jgi:hypothetical protein
MGSRGGLIRPPPSICPAQTRRPVKVVHVALADLGPGAGERRGARGRTAEPNYVMACVNEFRNEKGTDESGGACQKHSHPAPLVCAGGNNVCPEIDGRNLIFSCDKLYHCSGRYRADTIARNM